MSLSVQRFSLKKQRDLSTGDRPTVKTNYLKVIFVQPSISESDQKCLLSQTLVSEFLELKNLIIIINKFRYTHLTNRLSFVCIVAPKYVDLYHLIRIIILNSNAPFSFSVNSV